MDPLGCQTLELTPRDSRGVEAQACRRLCGEPRAGDSGGSGVRLCRILDMDFRESPEYELRVHGVLRSSYVGRSRKSRFIDS
jgi:hypothetical protein